jgi:hypothetical protein
VKRAWLTATIATGVVAGFSYATFVGMAAWDHNPQGEFHDWETGAIQWGAFGPLLGLAFSVPLVSVFLISGGLYAAVHFCRKYMP